MASDVGGGQVEEDCYREENRGSMHPSTYQIETNPALSGDMFAELLAREIQKVRDESQSHIDELREMYEREMGLLRHEI